MNVRALVWACEGLLQENSGIFQSSPHGSNKKKVPTGGIEPLTSTFVRVCRNLSTSRETTDEGKKHYHCASNETHPKS